MFGYGSNAAQQEQFAEQARQRRPIAYVLPHPEFEERHVGGSFPSPGSTLFLLVVLLLFSGRQPALHAPLQSNIAPIEELAKDLSEVDALMAAPEVLSKS